MRRSTTSGASRSRQSGCSATTCDDELVAGLSYSSVLKPVHDVLIFRALAESLDAVPATHSCNVAKPWCLSCAKCAYVWLGYQAFLPAATNRATFGDRNLLDDPANQLWFEQMLGLADHTPFECIGQIDEARLAFELLRRRGVTGSGHADVRGSHRPGRRRAPLRRPDRSRPEPPRHATTSPTRSSRCWSDSAACRWTSARRAET